MSMQALGLLALFSLLAGCAETEPYERMGVWRPLRANDTNLRAMVADPRDLELGRTPSASPGDAAALAVGRLRADAVKRLPASTISGVHVVDTGSNQGDSAPPATPSGAAPASGTP